MSARPLLPLLCLLFAVPALAETHQISQSGISWVPNELTIAVGDTVEWVWSAGSHTVTEGADDTTPPIEDKLFDAPLTSGDATFGYTFEDAGDVAFYCRPHRVVGMTGVIHVEAPTAAGEVETQSFAETKDSYR
jgi:plastocyanin